MNSGVLPNQYITQASMQHMGQGYQYTPMEINTAQQGKNAKLSEFWSSIMIEINALKNSSEKHHDLPMARIKKIMKMDDSVQSCMIGSEAPVVIAKACELFIRELTLQAWLHTEDNKRRTLQKPDIVTAVSENEMYDFLIDIIPRDDQSMDFSRGNPKVPPYDPMVYMFNNSNQLMDTQMGAMSNVAPGMSTYLPANQPSTYQQGLSTMLPQNQATSYNQNVPALTQPLPQPLPQTMQQPIPQTNSYLYMDNMGQVQNPAVVQGAPMMNSQLLGIYG